MLSTWCWSVQLLWLYRALELHLIVHIASQGSGEQRATISCSSPPQHKDCLCLPSCTDTCQACGDYAALPGGNGKPHNCFAQLQTPPNICRTTENEILTVTWLVDSSRLLYLMFTILASELPSGQGSYVLPWLWHSGDQARVYRSVTVYKKIPWKDTSLYASLKLHQHIT